MKKLIYILFISSLSIGINSCKKKGCMDVGAANYDADAKKDDGSCVYSPIITINGDNVMTISVGSGYTDLGATAANSDGSNVTVIVDSSMINDSVAGSFIVVYSASNEHGTTETIRTVNVVINHECWPGDWSVADDCGGGTGLGLNSTPNIIAGANNDQILINDFFNGLSSTYGTAICAIDGTDITVPSSSESAPGGLGTITYEGFGTMADDGKSFVITYVYSNSTPLTGGSGTCTATYNKQ
mgnify:CR=1 FL=1